MTRRLNIATLVLVGVFSVGSTAWAQQTFTITGTVTSDGQGLAGVTLVLSGTQSDTTTTAENGEYTFTALPAGTYRVTPGRDGYTFSPESLSMTFPGTGTTTPLFEATMTTATSTQESLALPEGFVLEQNYPNPFNTETVIRYHLARVGAVRLEVIDLLGRTVAVLVDGTQEAGVYMATVDAQTLSGGLYLYRLQASTTVLVKKMILVP